MATCLGYEIFRVLGGMNRRKKCGGKAEWTYLEPGIESVEEDRMEDLNELKRMRLIMGLLSPIVAALSLVPSLDAGSHLCH